MNIIQPLPSVSALDPGTWTRGTTIPGSIVHGPARTIMVVGTDTDTILDTIPDTILGMGTPADAIPPGIPTGAALGLLATRG